MQCVCSSVYSERPPSSELTNKKERKTIWLQHCFNISLKMERNFIERAILVVACAIFQANLSKIFKLLIDCSHIIIADSLSLFIPNQKKLNKQTRMKKDAKATTTAIQKHICITCWSDSKHISSLFNYMFAWVSFPPACMRKYIRSLKQAYTQMCIQFNFTQK